MVRSRYESAYPLLPTDKATLLPTTKAGWEREKDQHKVKDFNYYVKPDRNMEIRNTRNIALRQLRLYLLDGISVGS